jgi:hypothetical protein
LPEIRFRKIWWFEPPTVWMPDRPLPASIAPVPSVPMWLYEIRRFTAPSARMPSAVFPEMTFFPSGVSPMIVFVVTPER